jgi:YD repeat-containing protein
VERKKGQRYSNEFRRHAIAQMKYNALSRLTAAVTVGSTNYPQWGLSWSYDRYGNRLAQTVTTGRAFANSVAVDPTTNRITTAGYAYDAAGNITNDGVTRWSATERIG